MISHQEEHTMSLTAPQNPERTDAMPCMTCLLFVHRFAAQIYRRKRYINRKVYEWENKYITSPVSCALIGFSSHWLVQYIKPARYLCGVCKASMITRWALRSCLSAVQTQRLSEYWVNNEAFVSYPNPKSFKGSTVSVLVSDTSSQICCGCTLGETTEY